MGAPQPTIYTNPTVYLGMYGFSGAWTIWAMNRGLLDAICPRCRGTGHVFVRPCYFMEPRPANEWREEIPGHGQDEGCRNCDRRCPECKGAKLRPDDPILAKDIVTEKGLALRLGITLDPFETDGYRGESIR